MLAYRKACIKSTPVKLRSLPFLFGALVSLTLVSFLALVLFLFLTKYLHGPMALRTRFSRTYGHVLHIGV
ncbi:hypothetical protein M405DRAFT_208864 [Rhizopogon salebrosus TDB-379]|nr:hypothetical protein M405DRAFT_208864 [Rhizopogon salebrosus TDB-379]